MKSPQLFGAYLAVILSLLMAACSAKNSARIAKETAPKVVDDKTARTLGCSNASEYRFVEVENLNRRNDSDPATPKDLNILVGDQVISKIELPTADSEVKNFSLDSVEKTKEGFEMKVDWGGGLYHYEIQFNFRCKENRFYLYEVRRDSFSTTNPDTGNFLDKKNSKVITLEPNVPIEKFVMIDYL